MMTEPSTLWAIVVAGGSGARFGRRKQLAEFGGRRVIDWCLDTLRPEVAGLVAVLPADLVVGASDTAGREEPIEADVIVAGGSSRSTSVRAGLDALPATATHVLVHDAARPLADKALIRRVVDALSGADAVVPVVPVTDSLRRVEGGAVDRSAYVAVQTPQGFSIEALRAAHATWGEASDDASLVDELGGLVVHVDGDPRNLKITVPHDLLLAEALRND